MLERLQAEPDDKKEARLALHFDQTVPLARYLAAEKSIRGLDLSWSIELPENDHPANMDVPPMILQPFAENAIKHGISQLSAGGNIHIAASMQADHLSIEVTNTGQLQQKGKREGIGLKNLIERLQILFGQFADLKLENSGNQTVTASLKIPLV